MGTFRSIFSSDLRLWPKLGCRHERNAQQGARANDHGCHDPCSEQHGSRQPRSWLILNVGQKMKVLPLILLMLACGCVSSKPQRPSPLDTVVRGSSTPASVIYTGGTAL